MNPIQEFYNTYPFPGEYSWKQLMDIAYPPRNRYLAVIDKYLQDGQTVLDVGCGTGLITNLFASRYRSKFTGIDFSRGLDIAKQFAHVNHLQNVKYIKQDFDNFCPSDQFDVVIAQSFLTHSHNPLSALARLQKHTKPGGLLIFSVYNPAGQFFKKVCNLNYNNDRLALDQKSNPLDNVLGDNCIRTKFVTWRLKEIMPSVKNRLVALSALFNSRNGGLTIYVYENK